MDIFDIFWTFYLNHLSPLQGYFSITVSVLSVGDMGTVATSFNRADTPLSPVAHHNPTNERYRLCMFIYHQMFVII